MTYLLHTHVASWAQVLIRFKQAWVHARALFHRILIFLPALLWSTFNFSQEKGQKSKVICLRTPSKSVTKRWLSAAREERQCWEALQTFGPFWADLPDSA